jgi:AcrR family transcriptional regulator
MINYRSSGTLPIMTERRRRNLSAERQTEILEAFRRCIAGYGLEGSSTRRVATEAGISQSLLIHHFGSRAGLVKALVRYVVDEYEEALAQGLERASREDDAEVLLEYLFGRNYSEFSKRDDTMFPELEAAATRDVEIRRQLGEVYVSYRRMLVTFLRKTHPKASAAECRRVAYGLMCLSEANQTFRMMNLPGRRLRDALVCSRALIDSLAR